MSGMLEVDAEVLAVVHIGVCTSEKGRRAVEGQRLSLRLGRFWSACSFRSLSQVDGSGSVVRILVLLCDCYFCILSRRLVIVQHDLAAGATTHSSTAGLFRGTIWYSQSSLAWIW